MDNSESLVRGLIIIAAVTIGVIIAIVAGIGFLIGALV